MQKHFLALTLAAGFIGVTPSALADGMSAVLAGIDARESSTYAYIGVSHHFGDNPQGDGVVSRVFGYYGDYKYSTELGGIGTVKAEFSAFEALLGYRKVTDNVVMHAYLGPEYEGSHLSPDNPDDGNRGDHYGVKFRADVETSYLSPNYANLIATYGTARDRYWVRGRAGRDFSGYVIGPEILASGDQHSQEKRIGVFVNINTLLPAFISLSAGHAITESRSAGHTPYMSMEVSTIF